MSNLPVSLRRICMAIGCMALFCNGLLLAGYLFFGYEQHLHSDSAVRLLLAEEVVRTGELLPPSWNFVNADLWLLSAHWFAIPFVGFAPASPFIHGLAGAISASFVAMALWTLMVALNTSLSGRVWLTALLFSGFSGLTAEGLFGQASYSMIFASILLVLAAVVHVVEREQITLGWTILLAVLSALQIATNPLRGIVFCLLPLVLAMCFVSWNCFSERCSVVNDSTRQTPTIPGAKCLTLGAVMALGVSLGAVIRAALTPNLMQVPGVMSDFLQVNSLQQLPSILAILLEGILASLGSRPSPAPALSPEGVYHLFRLLLAVIAVALIVRAIMRGLADKRPSRRLLTFFAVSSFMLTAFICISTNLLLLSPDIEGIRYLMPATVLLLLLAFTDSSDWRKSPVIATLSLVLALGFAASGYSNFFMVDVASKWKTHEQDAYAWQSRELASLLQEQGLEYGYATYWFANSATVHSAGAVKVRPILFKDGLPAPRFWLSSNYWYSPSAWSGESFLALTAEEVKLIDQDRLELASLKPNRIIRKKGFEVWVFPVNLSANLAWGASLSQ